jgi:SAM-dependent methyltransferase
MIHLEQDADDLHARLPHAVLDMRSRISKAVKIERLLKLNERQGRLRMLEIGTGSGGIAEYFGTHESERFFMHSIDVVDIRIAKKGYDFTLVSGTDLPFADENFDVVISNHVIEHVGNAAAQRRHLAELRRVLRNDGVGYLAVPNRWMLLEPHFKVRFLSWWPRSWRTPYLRLASGDRKAVYDCEPLQMPEIERMFVDAGLTSHNICIEALRETFEIERQQSLSTKLLRYIPDALLLPMRRFIPTLIYRIWK